MAYKPEEIETLFNSICTFIAEGNSLRKALRREGMPHSTTFYKWLDSSKEKAAQYTRACEERQHVLFEECLEISNTPVEGIETTIDKDGNEIVKKGDMLQHRRLQIDTRKWMLGKMNPKKYGDKLSLDHEGNVGLSLNITKEEIKKINEDLEDEY